MDQFKLDSGQQFSLEKLSPTIAPLQDAAAQLADVPEWQAVVFLAGLFALAFLIGLLLSPEMRKLFLRAVARALTVFLFLYFLARTYSESMLQANAQENQSALSANTPQTPIPEFQPPQFSSLTIFFISLLAILFVLAPIGALIYWLFANSSIPKDNLPLKDIADLARASLRDLDAGREWDNVIVECYSRMIRAASLKRGILRNDAMTPAEFAHRLERSGLPAESVHRLTRLFEAARYGDQQSTQADIRDAYTCLSDILRFCGESA